MEAAVKPRRSVVKKQKKEAVKVAKKQGAAEAFLNNVPTSPRKMRLVTDIIRGEKVAKALSILKYQPQQGAKRLEKLLLSAISNWQAKNEGQDLDDLIVKEISVDAGRMLKRLRPAPQGRAYRVRKRSNHVNLVLDTINGSSPVKVAESVAKEVKTEDKKAKPAAKKAAAKKAPAKAKAESGSKKTNK